MWYLYSYYNIGAVRIHVSDPYRRMLCTISCHNKTCILRYYPYLLRINLICSITALLYPGLSTVISSYSLNFSEIYLNVWTCLLPPIDGNTPKLSPLALCIHSSSILYQILSVIFHCFNVFWWLLWTHACIAFASQWVCLDWVVYTFSKIVAISSLFHHPKQFWSISRPH